MSINSIQEKFSRKQSNFKDITVAKKGNSVHISLEGYAFWLAEITKLANPIKPFLVNNNKIWKYSRKKKLLLLFLKQIFFSNTQSKSEPKNSSEMKIPSKYQDMLVFWLIVRKNCIENEIEHEMQNIPQEELNYIFLDYFFAKRS